MDSTLEAPAPAIRLVVIEDDAKFAANAGQALGLDPCLQLVGSARDVSAARGLLRDLRPDVALVDLGLGDESGLAVIGFARREVPDCELLVLTMFEDDVTVLAAIEAGASGYVLKGCSADELRAHIHTVHAGGSPISPRVARRLLSRLSVKDSAAVSSPSGVAPEAGTVALSTQELQMLQLAAKGCPHDEIAQLMGVSRNTVLTYAKRCYRKLQVHSRSEAVYEARRMGLLKD